MGKTSLTILKYSYFLSHGISIIICSFLIYSMNECFLYKLENKINKDFDIKFGIFYQEYRKVKSKYVLIQGIFLIKIDDRNSRLLLSMQIFLSMSIFMAAIVPFLTFFSYIYRTVLLFCGIFTYITSFIF